MIGLDGRRRTRLRRLTGWVVVVLGSVLAGAANQNPDAEIMAIEQMMDEYFALLTDRDSRALSTYYTDDAVVSTGSTVVVGRVAITHLFGELESDPPARLTRERLEMLSSTVAVAHGRFVFDGEEGRYLRVLVKRRGVWRIARLQVSQ